MDISLSKLPWWGQILAFVLVCGGAIYGFYNFFVTEYDAELALKRTHLNSLRADINKGVATARRLPEFQAQVTDLEHRLEAHPGHEGRGLGVDRDWPAHRLGNDSRGLVRLFGRRGPTAEAQDGRDEAVVRLGPFGL